MPVPARPDRRIGWQPTCFAATWAFGVLLGTVGCSSWPLGGGGASDATVPSRQLTLAAEGASVQDWAESVMSAAPDYSAEEAQRVSRQIVAYLPNEQIAWNRRQLVLALGSLGIPDALHGLDNALADPDPQVRQAACSGLGNVRQEQAIHLLAQTLTNDTDLDVRLAAARALGQHRRPSAVLALAAALDESDPALRYRAIQSMEAITDRRYGGDTAAWKKYAAELMIQP